MCLRYTYLRNVFKVYIFHVCIYTMFAPCVCVFVCVCVCVCVCVYIHRMLAPKFRQIKPKGPPGVCVCVCVCVFMWGGLKKVCTHVYCAKDSAWSYPKAVGAVVITHTMVCVCIHVIYLLLSNAKYTHSFLKICMWFFFSIFFLGFF